MRRIKGFKLRKRFLRVATWIFTRRRRNCSLYNRLVSGDDGSTSSSPRYKPIRKIIDWGRRLTTGAKSLCSAKPGNYLRVEEQKEPLCEKAAAVPKGHLAVYVGEKDGGGGGCHRVFVPVIYVNHPLFGDLLREAEQEYGFSQEGGITIPCPFAEFERVKTRIDAGTCGGRRLHTWKRNHY